MELTDQKGKATGEKGPATALELGTYALSQSFSHTSHRDRSRSFVPHRSYVSRVISLNFIVSHI